MLLWGHFDKFCERLEYQVPIFLNGSFGPKMDKKLLLLYFSPKPVLLAIWEVSAVAGITFFMGCSMVQTPAHTSTKISECLCHKKNWSCLSFEHHPATTVAIASFFLFSGLVAKSHTWIFYQIFSLCISKDYLATSGNNCNIT